MQTLNTFTLVAIKRPVQQPAIVGKRDKLLAAIAEQVEIAKARAAGDVYYKTVNRKARDRETGELKPVQTLTYPKAWWWAGNDGKTYLSLRYGKRLLELGSGNFAIQVPDTADIAEVLQQVKASVTAGEFDEALSKVARFGSRSH